MQFNSTIFSKTTFAQSAAVACFLYVGYELNRENFYALLGCFGILFSAYYFLVKNAKTESLNQLLVIGVLFRLFFLFSIPTLSDDYLRFIWDGQLLANGINPFDYLPTEVTIDFPNKAELLADMNSSNYYTVYPPIAQTIYFLSAWLSPNSIFGSILVMRSILFAAEIGIIVLLPKLLPLQLYPSGTAAGLVYARHSLPPSKHPPPVSQQASMRLPAAAQARGMAGSRRAGSCARSSMTQTHTRTHTRLPPLTRMTDCVRWPPAARTHERW